MGEKGSSQSEAKAPDRAPRRGEEVAPFDAELGGVGRRLDSNSDLPIRRCGKSDVFDSQLTAEKFHFVFRAGNED